jgi:hypothetical protein
MKTIPQSAATEITAAARDIAAARVNLRSTSGECRQPAHRPVKPGQNYVRALDFAWAEGAAPDRGLVDRAPEVEP